MNTESRFSGFHSIIEERTSPPGTLSLLKHYGAKVGGFEQGRALDIAHLMRSFVEKGREVGIPIVEPYGYYLLDNQHPGRVDLVEFVPYKGANLQECFDNTHGHGEVLDLLEEYLGMYKRVWDAGSPISLDPPPLNFCLDEEGVFWYVDCMPPRQKLEDGRVISEWPEPPESSREFIEARYFEPFYQLRVVYAQLLRSLASREDITPELIKETIAGVVGNNLRLSLELDSGLRRRIAQAPQPEDVDLLRILTGEAYLRGQIKEAHLKHLYHLTHIGIGGILPEAEALRGAVAIL